MIVIPWVDCCAEQPPTSNGRWDKGARRPRKHRRVCCAGFCCRFPCRQQLGSRRWGCCPARCVDRIRHCQCCLKSASRARRRWRWLPTAWLRALRKRENGLIDQRSTILELGNASISPFSLAVYCALVDDFDLATKCDGSRCPHPRLERLSSAPFIPLVPPEIQNFTHTGRTLNITEPKNSFLTHHQSAGGPSTVVALALV